MHIPPSGRNRQPNTRLQCIPKPDSVELELWRQNVDASPLLRLPPEIRNRIYALVLTAGQIHIRYRPWRQRQRSHGGKQDTKTGRGGFYATLFGADQDPWDADVLAGVAPRLATCLAPRPAPVNTQKCSSPFAAVYGGNRDGNSDGNRDGNRLCPLPVLTLLSPICRQLYRDTAVLPFCLNVWSFANSRLMERYLVRENRLTLAQRRAIRVLLVSDNLPTRSMEKRLGGLRLVIWKDGKTFQCWELNSAAEMRRLVDNAVRKSSPSRQAGVGLFWRLYE